MSSTILITGSSGLIGSALRRAFEAQGDEVRCLDLLARGSSAGDVRDPQRLRAAFDRVDGVVHLAAVSRVVWAERAPDECQSTNVVGTRNVLHAAAASARRPWVLFASSREVYGEPEKLPVDEAAPLQPLNVYGRSKVEGEALVAAARRDGVRATVVRLSNVYGSVDDHVDRVVPAFVRAAIANDPLHVEGAEHVFDFTHVDDVASGLRSVCQLLAASGVLPPPVHLVSGVGTTLLELATMARRLAGAESPIQVRPARRFDVTRFIGCPERARQLLGWSAQTNLETGMRGLIRSLREARAATTQEVTR
jgi:nucleoside-diphosphate-sugar epimerase